jgi:hypothetical protein
LSEHCISYPIKNPQFINELSDRPQNTVSHRYSIQSPCTLGCFDKMGINLTWRICWEWSWHSGPSLQASSLTSYAISEKHQHFYIIYWVKCSVEPLWSSVLTKSLFFKKKHIYWTLLGKWGGWGQRTICTVLCSLCF